MMLPDTTIDFTTVEVTVAFVDLAGYSVLTEACGDREAAQLIVVSLILAFGALVLSEWFARRAVARVRGD